MSVNKICSECQILKLSEEFSKYSFRKCNVCYKKIKKEYYNNNRESILQNKKEYAIKNKDKIKEKQSIYYENNKENLNLKNKEYYDTNRENILQNKKEYNINNKEKITEKNKKYYAENKEDLLIKNKEWLINNEEAIKQYKKEYNENNKEKIKLYRAEYYKNNKEKIRISQNKCANKRRKTDPAFRLRNNVRCMIGQALKEVGSSKNNQSFLPFVEWKTIDELKIHLESLFDAPYNLTPEGKVWMSWENYGQYKLKSWVDGDFSTYKWSIDHIIPQSDLLYISMKEDNFKKSWALSNLRPYNAKLNGDDGAQRIRHKRSNINKLP